MFIDRIMINSFTQCTFFFFSFRLFIVFVRVYMRIPFTFRVFTRTKCTRLVVQFLLSNLRNYPRPFPFLFLFLYLVAMENYISLYIKKKKKIIETNRRHFVRVLWTSKLRTDRPPSYVDSSLFSRDMNFIIQNGRATIFSTGQFKCLRLNDIPRNFVEYIFKRKRKKEGKEERKKEKKEERNQRFKHMVWNIRGRHATVTNKCSCYLLMKILPYYV